MIVRKHKYHQQNASNEIVLTTHNCPFSECYITVYTITAKSNRIIIIIIIVACKLHFNVLAGQHGANSNYFIYKVLTSFAEGQTH